MKYYTALMIGSVALMYSCSSPDPQKAVVEQEEEIVEETTVPEGARLMEKNCNICHASEGNNQIAPTMTEVKMYYLRADLKRHEFVDAVVTWALEPSEERSYLPDEIREKYGVMPEQHNFTEEEVETIAKYIYDTDLGQ